MTKQIRAKFTPIVTDKCIKGSINGKVRHLKKADRKPYVHLPRGGKPALMVTRYGNCEPLAISKRVAEELIAAGFGYGD